MEIKEENFFILIRFLSFFFFFPNTYRRVYYENKWVLLELRGWRVALGEIV